MTTKNNMNPNSTPSAQIITPKAEAPVIESLKDLITASIKKEKELKEKIATASEELKSGLQAIPDYRRTELEAEKAVNEKKKKKNHYMQRPELARTEQKLKELRAERKENKETQASYASEYYRLTQMSLFELPDGTEVQIENRATAKMRMPRLTLKGRHGNTR